MKNNIGQSKTESCLAEGWEVIEGRVFAYGEEFPLSEPYAICLKVYRTHPSLETRYQAMKRAFELIWPEQVLTFNYWMERIFREHCNFDTEIFTLAAGGGVGKTQAMAYVACLFWLALPHKRAVVVTSTTLASLKKRIYGFILRALDEANIELSLRISNTPPPTISLDPPDFIHGIFGVAAKEGSDENTIKDIIGHHPKNAYLLILDEAPDMPVAIMNAIPNMKKALEDRFQGCAIGNPNSTDDLHGALSTPKVGWDNIDPKTTFRWETTQPGGVCLYFNPYDSPAIHEVDPIKRKALGKFLMTEEKLLKAEQEEGTESESFWRMTMGFWRNRSTNRTIVSKDFLTTYDPTGVAEFSGRYPLIICAGLDPAFSTGGDKCILRLAILGHHVNGFKILDFRGASLLFHIKILASTGKSAEIQIADEVIRICKQHRVPLNTLCIDASGAGRGLGDVIQLRSEGGLTPTKIYSTNVGNRNVKAFDVKVSSAYEMWIKGREFITHGQIFGMDPLSIGQLYTRRILRSKEGKETLERKDDYKKRMSAENSLLGRSPDECDASMLCLQSAILHYGFHPGQKLEQVRYDSVDQKNYEQALREYKERNVKSKVFNLNPNYSRGLVSVVKKRAF